MSSYMHFEVLLFFQSALMGVILLLCYDLLVILRRVIPHAPGIVNAEDLLYWIAVCGAVFSQIYRLNQGMLRGFVLLGIILGAILCHLTVGPLFVRLLSFILGTFVFGAKKIINMLLFPVKRGKIFLCNFVRCSILSIRRILHFKKDGQGEGVKEKSADKQNRE